MIAPPTSTPTVAEVLQKAATLFRSRRYEQALELYKQLAVDGNVSAQAFLGWMYVGGLGIAKNSTIGLEWLDKAAKAGSAEAMFFAGRVLSDLGRHAEALAYYRAAESKSYAPALYRLGIAYKHGQGVERDRRRAVMYFSTAAERGHLFARRELALDAIANGGPLAKLKGLGFLFRGLVQAIRTAAVNKCSDELKG